MKRSFAVAVVVAAGLASAAALAQHKGSGSGSGSGSVAGYSGFDKRQVASFSDDDVSAMRDGRGLGFALPAEINGYPGPMHILDLAAELGLSAAQRAEVETLFQRMKARASLAGDAFVRAEMALDAAFKAKVADAATITRLTREADQKRSEKRLAHFEAHIEARGILSDDQRKRYASLRGYGTKQP